jgi:hypothetical protein
MRSPAGQSWSGGSVLAEVAYEMLPLIVRRQLHARLARAVERRGPDDVRDAVDELAGAYAAACELASSRAGLRMPFPPGRWQPTPRRIRGRGHGG